MVPQILPKKASAESVFSFSPAEGDVGLRELATHSSHEYYSILMETSMPTMTAVAMVNVSSMSPPFGPILPSSTKV